MSTMLFFKRFGLVQQASGQLCTARTLEEVFEILRAQARAIADADGVAVIRRDGDHVAYIGEDAISPLWTGQRFPIRRCVSGLAMLARQPIIIPDIAADDRVPLSAYLATFVRSMALFPLGRPAPVAALGCYWKEVRPLGRDVEALMGFLSQAANAAFEQIAMTAERAAMDLGVRQVA